MNWVGGSRNRLMMRNDSKKQKEFFAKRKMQQRLTNMGLSLPAASPVGTSSRSMDLVNLSIVNQIAASKPSTNPPKVAVFGSSKGRFRCKEGEPLVLPMSPCSPSQLNLVESDLQDSVQGIRKRKKIVAQGFKCQQLSPVLQSAFSDGSASDYVPPEPDLHSPFSSTPSSSSGQGIFSLPLSLQKQSQMRSMPLPHYSPPPWDTSIIQQTKFRPYSEPREISWSVGTNPPLFHMQIPTAAQSLFASPEPDETPRRDYGRHVATFPFNQPEDEEPTLDFILNQSENKLHLEEEVFRGFNHEEYEGEASHFKSGESKIYLTDKTRFTTSAAQIVSDSRCRTVQLSNCTEINFTCLGSDTGSMNGCDSLPSYSSGGGYLSSGSSDPLFCNEAHTSTAPVKRPITTCWKQMDGECCHPCLQASASYMDSAADAVTTNNCSLGTPNLRDTCTPLLKSNLRDDQTFPENLAHPDEARGNKGPQTEGSTAQIASPHASLQPQSSETCRCRRSPTEVRDAQTQTARGPAAQTRDTSTQCSLVATGETEYPSFRLCLPKADLLQQRAATGRQGDPTEEAETLPASTPHSRSEGEPTPWRKKKSKSDAALSSSFIHKITAAQEGRFLSQRPTRPFLGAMNKANSRERVEGRDQSARQDTTLLAKEPLDGGTDEVTSVSAASILSERTETLLEIADILLQLKQNKKE